MIIKKTSNFCPHQLLFEIIPALQYILSSNNENLLEKKGKTLSIQDVYKRLTRVHAKFRWSIKRRGYFPMEGYLES